MIYKDCLPAAIVERVAANPNETSTEIAAGLGIKRARVVDVLPGLLERGHVVREGRRKQYRYRVPSQGFAPHIPADAPKAPPVVSFVADNTEPEDVVLSIARIHGDARAAAIDAKFAALKAAEENTDEDPPEYGTPASSWITTEDDGP
jgi:sugar-specific transcriptional regulator TrmB